MWPPKTSRNRFGSAIRSQYLYIMNRAEFDKSLALKEPPANWSPVLRALWLEAKEQWESAHDIIQELSDSDGAAMHAYLHRKEGDIFNAQYWYRRAGLKAFQGSLAEEFDWLLLPFLDE